MSAFFQTGADRAQRRGAGLILFRPPVDQQHLQQWHDVDTHLGRRRMQWQPGIDVWRGENAERWTAAFGGENGWTYVGIAANQAGTKLTKRTQA